MKNLYAIFLMIFLIIAFSNCKDKDSDLRMSTYEGCCNNPPIQAQVGTGRVYIPNFFAAGIEGEIPFTVHADTNIIEVKQLEIRNMNGQVIFTKSNFRPNNIDVGWDGSNVNEQNKGLCPFTVRIVGDDGQTEVINGFVCVFYCTAANSFNTIEELSSCSFGNQHDGNGYFNPNIPSQVDYGDCSF